MGVSQSLGHFGTLQGRTWLIVVEAYVMEDEDDERCR